MIDYQPKKSLVFCSNHEFIIKVDELQNQKIRYRCWRRPKTVSHPPDLILLNRNIRVFDQEDKLEFVFPFGEWTYVLEKITSKDTLSTSHIFLEVSDNQNQRFT
ncbi:hypothetical protein GTQ34_03165 [Muricauda sp. JGD-17]|uniref:Uncharacterized protein n=1 Tax=Flagellimonas ochracea TaxID=2696472 RepID=A0A964WWL7_9FLAO|nr:hypothetical protein [Allomuricauda ochracea]NAY90908.1 hypothetical protein [Allomuricauda ochracea]